MSPDCRDMTSDLDQVGLSIQMTSLCSFHFPHIKINWNSLENKEKCVCAWVCECGRVPASPSVCHLVSSRAVAKQVGGLMPCVPVSWLSGSPAGWRSLSSRSSWAALQRSKPGTAGSSQAALWTRTPGCWRPRTPEKQKQITTWTKHDKETQKTVILMDQRRKPHGEMEYGLWITTCQEKGQIQNDGGKKRLKYRETQQRGGKRAKSRLHSR